MNSPTVAADTFAGCWAAAVDTHGARPFLVYTEGSAGAPVSRWTYAEFDEVVARVAAVLRDAGVGPGDAVHVALRNCPAFVALWLAVARLGAWLVPVDPASTSRDIAAQIERIHPAVGVCAEQREAEYRAGADDLVPRILVLNETADDLGSGGALIGPENPIGAGTVIDRGGWIDPAARLAVLLTSGTTSEPKGVVLTQRNYARAATAMSTVIALGPQDRWFVSLPLFHANAQYYCFAPAIAVGASVGLVGRFSASRWLIQAAELNISHASLFAAPIRMILARQQLPSRPLRLRHVWFAQSLGVDHYEQFAGLVGCRPRQLYGMTETVAIVTFDQRPQAGHDKIGTPVAGRVIRISDERTGTEVALGVPGVLEVRGEPGDDLFSGYLDDPATTARSMRGGWFRTGDLVAEVKDTGGMLRFVGRVDDVIKVAGENVSLTEVEAVLAQAPGVLEVAVVAASDPIRDQVPVAYVVAKDPKIPPTEKELARWAAANLTPAARPQRWHTISRLPRTSVGKVRRFVIAAETATSEPGSSGAADAPGLLDR